jgi:hypothetical protein
MTRPLSAIFFLCCFTLTQAQDFEKLKTLELKSKSDYKAIEGEILKCATFILTTPDEPNENRRLAFKSIIMWMSGTAEYSFDIDESLSPLMKNNDSIVGLYMASMSKYVLENPDRSKNKSEVKLNSYTYLLDYCEKELNGVKQTKELKRAIAAKNENRLKEYLRL